MSSKSPAQASAPVCAPLSAPAPVAQSGDPLLDLQQAGGGGNQAALDLIAGRSPISAGELTQTSIDPRPVLERLSEAWDQGARTARGLGVKSARNDLDPGAYGFARSPLETKVAKALHEECFLNSPFWSSDWLDDGYNDLESLGLWDASVKVDLTAWAQDLRTVRCIEAEWSDTAGQTSETRQTDGYEAAAEASGKGARLGGKLTGSEQLTSGRTSGTSTRYDAPTWILESELVIDGTLTFATLAGEYHTDFTLLAGTARYKREAS